MFLEWSLMISHSSTGIMLEWRSRLAIRRVSLLRARSPLAA